MIWKRWLSMVSLIAVSGCTMGPNYKRPAVTAPDTFRSLAPDASADNSAASIGDQHWEDVFKDPDLQDLIRQALKANYDVRIAAQRVLEAQAQVGIARADQFPLVTGGAAAANVRNAQTRLTPPLEMSPQQLNLAVIWNLDFWGQYRRATEAARANLLATEWGKKAVIGSLVTNVAAAYFQLLEMDQEMEIAKRTLGSRKESLRLVDIRYNGGTVSLLDVRQAEQLVFSVQSAISNLEQQIGQQEDLITTLLGQNPGPVKRTKTLLDTQILPTLPAGLPSALLERRPDIQSAEQQLVAANAQIGIAKAAFFPQIAITGAGGVQTNALTNLFTTPAGFWSIGAGLTQPIFTGGKLKANVQLTEARQQELVLSYQQTIQQAFRQVSDSLIAYRKTQEFREHQAEVAKAAVDATRLANVRYQGGVSSYLEVLDLDTLAFNAEITLAQADFTERLALVQLYNSLGGGWKE